MPQLVTLDTDIAPDRVQALMAAAHDRDPDVVYLVHSYNRDDWYGAGTPYRTLAGALIAAGIDDYDGPWADAAEIMNSDGYRAAHPVYPQEPGVLWWPLECDGDPINPRDWGDNHAYVERARVLG